MAKPDRYFAERIDALANLQGRYGDLVAKLQVSADGNREQQFKNAIRALYNKADPASDEVKGHFEGYMAKSLALFERLREDLHGHDSDWALDAERARRLRADERADQWVTWGHRTIRWVASSLLALALYSGAVTLTDYWDFVHVPVHDWFAKPHDQ